MLWLAASHGKYHPAKFGSHRYCALDFDLRRCCPSLEATLGWSYICFSVFKAFEKFRDSEPKSTNPQ